MACRQYKQEDRTVLKANAREGKYHARKAPYGYVKSDTEKKTPIIDEEAAAVVKGYLKCEQAV